jgi:hypothetical protein
VNYRLVPNPAWAGQQPSALTESDCHDRSHCVSVECACGKPMHLHESQIAGQEHATIATLCPSCGDLLSFEPGFFHDAFAAMRQQGWIR